MRCDLRGRENLCLAVGGWMDGGHEDYEGKEEGV